MTILTESIELFSEIRKALSNKTEAEEILPKIITYTKDNGLSVYKITIEKSEPDFFIDSKGRKWRRED